MQEYVGYSPFQQMHATLRSSQTTTISFITCFLSVRIKYAINTMYGVIEGKFAKAYLLFSKLPTIHYWGNWAVAKHHDCFKTLPPVEIQTNYEDHLTVVWYVDSCIIKCSVYWMYHSLTLFIGTNWTKPVAWLWAVSGVTEGEWQGNCNCFIWTSIFYDGYKECC